jgi:hypothetical protein
LGALLLRSGPAPATPARVPPPQQASAPQRAPAPAVSADGGPVDDASLGREFVPSDTATDNGSPARPADGLPDVSVDARPRDT